MRNACLPSSLALAIVALASVGCGSPSPTVTPASAPAAATAAAASDVAPAPFTADQLRAATRVGRTYVFRVEEKGKAPVLREMRFTRVEAEQTEVTTTIKDADGKVTASPPPMTAKWVELQKHGEFPRDQTTTSEAPVKVPAGSYSGIVYTVRRSPGRVDVFQFAKELPGPPVLFTTDEGGERTKTTTLVEYRPGG